MYHHHSQQEGPPPVSDRPGPFHRQEQGHQQQHHQHQQQQQHHHSHFQYPPTNGSRDIDMAHMNMDVGMHSDRMNGSGPGGYQEGPPQPFSNRPGPFHHQEQGHQQQQQQQQQHSHFQYPPIKSSRDLDMPALNMDVGKDSDRTNGSGSGGYLERPPQHFSDRPGPFHQQEQGLQQHQQQHQQQQQHSHFQYPPIKSSRDMDVGKDSDRVNESGSGGYQERPPQPLSDRPGPFHQQEQGLQQHQEQQQQQQQQQHSHFQYPPNKSSRDLDMYSDRTNGSGPGGYYSSAPQRLSESQPGHQRVPLERAAPDRSDYQQHPGQTFSSPPSTVTQQQQPAQSSHSAAGLQAWTHRPPSPPTRGSHSGDVDGQGVREKQAWTHGPPPPPTRGSHSRDVDGQGVREKQAWMHEPPLPQTRGSHSGDVGVAQGVRESAGSILAGLGLSSRDLELLSQYPEDQLTPDKLPYLLQDMLGRRKPNEQNIAASSSSSSYSQNATQRAARRETMPPPPPSSSQGSSGRQRSPEASGLCIEYGHSSISTVFRSGGGREAFIPRETLSSEGESPRPPASSSLPKQEMDVTPQHERWQVGPQPAVPNNMHGDQDYHMSSGEVHRSKQSPAAAEERPLPPRSGRPDPDYRRDGLNRYPSSETFDYGHSSLSTVLSSGGREAFIPREPLSNEIKMASPPCPPASSSLPRQEMDVAPERWQFGAQPAVPNMHGDRDYRMSSGEVHRSKRSPVAECPLPPRSAHPHLDYRRDGPKPNPSPEAFDYGHSNLTTVFSSSREAFIQREPLSSEGKTASSSLPKQETHERWQFGAQPTVSNNIHRYLDYHMSSGEVHRSKQSPVEAECPLPPRPGHPDQDYRSDRPKPSSSSETRSDQPSSSWRPAPWSSVSEPGDGTQRTPTPSTMCDLSESPKDWSDQVKKAKITEYFRDLQNKAQLSLGQDDLPATRERSPSGAVSARRERTERERERLKPGHHSGSSSRQGPEGRTSNSTGHHSGSSTRRGPEKRRSRSPGHHKGSSSSRQGPEGKNSNSTGHHSGSSTARHGPEKRRSRSPGHHKGSSSSTRHAPESTAERRKRSSPGHPRGSSSSTSHGPERRTSNSPGHHKGSSSSTSHGPEKRRSQSPGHHKGSSSTSHGPEKSSSPGLHKGTASSTRRAPESRTINCPGHHIIVSSSSSTSHGPERRSSNSPELSSRDSLKHPRDSATRDDDSARRKPKESPDHGKESPSSDEEEDSVVKGSDCPVLVYPRWTTGRRGPLLPKKKKRIRGKKKAFVGGFLYSIV